MLVRSAVVIVEDGKVALIERVRGGRTYFVFPGGGTELDETTEDAAVREAREELGVEVELERVVCVARHAGREERYYAAEIVGGAFGAGEGEEMVSSVTIERGSYRPVWMSLKDLAEHDVRPEALADALPCGALDGAVLRVDEGHVVGRENGSRCGW